MLVMLEGHRVLFPYKAYECQKDYMRRVIEAASRQQNALLESPTGTGKTLSLLCSALAWLSKQKELEKKNFPLTPAKIIYLTRTHSQITQVIRELKKTAYTPSVSILGSRDVLCVNPYVNKEKGRDFKCLMLKKQRQW